MPRRKKDPIPASGSCRRATTPEGREDQLIALAYDLAEKQMRDGTISAQVLAQFIKRGSTKGRLENKILEEQKKLVVAKTDSLESAKRDEEFYGKVLDAMRKYSGQDDSDEMLQ